jgi:hypothetical protein
MLTRAESSGWTETSTHADVMRFLSALDDPRLHRKIFGETPEGRALPLLVLSTRGVRTPDDARRAGLPVVLVMCGIHAGEVEGKEAGMMLVRDLLAGAHPGLLEAITLVVVPLFNPDGNDRIDPANRALDLAKLTGQLGPASGVGTRVNASGINLNRDYLRQAACEMRLLQAWVAQPWRADLTIDCHATNGSVHRFDLTYDVPHPIESGRAEPIEWMRDVLLPEATARVRAATGRETFFYGNFVEDEGGEGEGWMTYTHHPRFGGNYRGLTGRCDLLLETYAYIPFEARVATTYAFLVEALRIAGERGAALSSVVEAARTPRERIAVRYRLDAAPEPARILTRAPRTLDGAPIEVTIPHLARFVGTRVVDRPWGYAVPPAIGEHLARHGLAVEILDEALEVAAEVPVIEQVRQSDPRAILEAAGETLLDARLERRVETLRAGTALVAADQPLGAIAVYLCEAESDDGLVASGLVPCPAPGDVYAALRVVEAPRQARASSPVST